MSALRRRSVAVLGLLLLASAAHAQNAPEQAAEVNGRAITSADVDAKLGGNLAKLQEQIFSLRQKQLDAMIDQALLEDEAAKRRVTVAALIQAEITSRVTPVTAEEVATFHEENKAKLKGDAATIEGQIRNFLAAQRIQARQQEYLKSLRASANIAVFLTPPPTFRTEVKTDGAPFRGASNAPVTVVEFSDFHCPFCRRVQPVLDQLLAKYGDKVRIVYRDYPIDRLHAQARTVAEASRCASEQGKFWEFHDKVFASAPDSSQATLNRFAQEVGMEVAAFEACRAATKYKASVEESIQEGTKLGITGTPTFFINGRVLVGAQPFDAFAKVIDEELAAAGRR